MTDEKSIVRRPYRNEYKETQDDEIDADIYATSEINTSDKDEPSEDTATSVENPDTEELPGTEDKDSVDATSNASPVEPEAKVWKKRYDDGRRYQNKLIERNKLLEAQVNKTAEVSLPQNKDEIAEWKDKFPDVYEMVSSIASNQAEAKTAKMRKQVEEVSQAQEEVVFERAYNKIVKSHPDFDEIIGDAAFHTWAETQPASIQNALYENRSDSAAAIRAIDLYKYDHKPKTTPKKTAAQAVTKTKTSDAVEGKEPKIWTESEIQALTPREYEMFEAEIDKANIEGRISRA